MIIQAAERLLVNLGALTTTENDGRIQRPTAAKSQNVVPVITSLGRTMAQFPVAPRYAKMLALGRQHGCLPYIIAIVASLSVKEIFAESDLSTKYEEGSGNDDDDDEFEAVRKRQRRIASRRRAWAGKVSRERENFVKFCVTIR